MSAVADVDIVGASAHRMPGQVFTIDLSGAGFTPTRVASASSGAEFFWIAGNGGVPAALITLGKSDLDFFEGELSVLRMMGFIRLHHIRAAPNDPDTTDILNRQVEVRAWMYKTWQQDVNSTLGIINPFFVDDFDARVLWTAHWLTRIDTGAVVESESAESHLQEGGTTNFFNAPQVSEAEHFRVRSIGLRRAVKITGNERIAIVFAVGPLPEVQSNIALRFTGYLRMLIKH